MVAQYHHLRLRNSAFNDGGNLSYECGRRASESNLYCPHVCEFLRVHGDMGGNGRERDEGSMQLGKSGGKEGWRNANVACKQRNRIHVF